MKKLLITVSPFCIMLFILLWLTHGLEIALLMFFGILLSFFVLIPLIIKWMEFVNKHFDDYESIYTNSR